MFVPELEWRIDEDVSVVIEFPPPVALDISGLASAEYTVTDDDEEGSDTAIGRGRISPAITVAIWAISSWESLTGSDTGTDADGNPVDEEGHSQTSKWLCIAHSPT